MPTWPWLIALDTFTPWMTRRSWCVVHRLSFLTTQLIWGFYISCPLFHTLFFLEWEMVQLKHVPPDQHYSTGGISFNPAGKAHFAETSIVLCKMCKWFLSKRLHFSQNISVGDIDMIKPSITTSQVLTSGGITVLALTISKWRWEHRHLVSGGCLRGTLGTCVSWAAVGCWAHRSRRDKIDVRLGVENSRAWGEINIQDRTSKDKCPAIWQKKDKESNKG